MRTLAWMVGLAAVIVAVGVGLMQVGATKTERKGQDQWPPYR